MRQESKRIPDGAGKTRDISRNPVDLRCPTDKSKIPAVGLTLNLPTNVSSISLSQTGSRMDWRS